MPRFFRNNKNKAEGLASLRGRSGSALILTMFILAGMLIAAMGGSYVVLMGIKAGGVQSDSTKAYYVAEAGTERFLWELRKNGYNYPDTQTFPVDNIFSDTLPNGGDYQVNFTSGYAPPIFEIIGGFQNTKRSIEIRI